MIEQAKKLAYQLHAEQRDKAGKPYIEHLTFVANNVNDYGEVFVVVAWLHDSLEDTSLTFEQLKDQFGDDVANAVNAMTKRPDEPYLTYLERVKANSIAKQVKLADLTHNMDLDRLNVVTKKDLSRLAKYQKAKIFLET